MIDERYLTDWSGARCDTPSGLNRPERWRACLTNAKRGVLRQRSIVTARPRRCPSRPSTRNWPERGGIAQLTRSCTQQPRTAMNEPAIEAFVPSAVEAIRWSDRYLLGHAKMDDLHREFVDLIGLLQIASNDQLEPLLDELLIHAQMHFGEEDEWMASTEFPPRECHMKEHAAVLASIRQVRGQATMGIYVFCRPFADELAGWFPRPCRSTGFRAFTLAQQAEARWQARRHSSRSSGR